MLAFLFPGQGSQKVGMGKEIAQQFPVAKRTFEEADDILGMALSKLCFEGPDEQLQLTANSQPALVTTSIAVLRALQEVTGLSPSVVAGHSLGEYSALVCAEAMSFADAVRIARARGTYMQEAVPQGQGAMAAVMGMSVPDVEQLCKDAAQGQVLTTANYNGPIQTVIAGHTAAVERAVTLAGQRDGTAKLLKVSAPFHCPLMEPAAAKLAADLAKVAFKDPVVPVVSNVDAEPNKNGKRLAELLTKQVTGAVRWEGSVRRMAEMGVTLALEIGVGKTLTGLVKRIDARVQVTPVEEAKHLGEVKARGDLAAFAKKGSGAAAATSPAPQSGASSSAQKPQKKDWADMNAEERKAWVAQLVTLDEICKVIEMEPKEVFWAITIKQMPSALVGGEWKFDKAEVAQWAQDNGGLPKVRDDVRRARSEHKAAQEAMSKPKAAEGGKAS